MIFIKIINKIKKYKIIYFFDFLKNIKKYLFIYIFLINISYLIKFFFIIVLIYKDIKCF